MRRMIHTVIFLGLVLAAPAWGLNGSVSAVHTEGFSEGQLYDSGLILRFDHSLSLGNTELRGDGRLRWNTSGCAATAAGEDCDVDPLQFDWRELYLSRNIGDWQLSAGLQQVVWGRADSLRVVDVPNPLDLRDFLLPDFNESRMSSAMIRGTGPVGQWNLEALWLPYFKPTRLAAEGTPYDLRIDRDFRDSGLETQAAARPPRNGSRGELALRAATTRGPLDIDIVVFNGYNDDAVYVLEPTGFDAVGIRPVYRRHSLVGASAAYAFESGWVLRSEAAWSPDMPYSNLIDAETIRAATFLALIGLDYQWRDWLFSAQINDRKILSLRPEMGTPEHAAIVTFSATGNTHQGKMLHRIAWTVMPQYGDGNWLQWRTSWQFDDHWQVEGNFDLLNGRDSGFLGQFSARDRLRMELRYQF